MITKIINENQQRLVNALVFWAKYEADTTPSISSPAVNSSTYGINSRKRATKSNVIIALPITILLFVLCSFSLNFLYNFHLHRKT